MRISRVMKGFAVGLLGIAMAGCSKSPGTTPIGPGGDDIQGIHSSYKTAMAKLGRAPKSMDELKPFLEASTKKNVNLTSPNDGMPYGIVWGGKPKSNYPIVYEQKGTNGKRWVINAMGWPQQVTDAEFAEFKFPPSHKL